MNAGEDLLTAEHLLAAEYERGELWDGVFQVREPSGGWAGAVSFRVGAALASTFRPGAGWAFTADQGFVVARDPDRVLSPDVSFVSAKRMPVPPRTGFIEGAPEFAVEVRSPSDSWTATIEKGGVWIGHGARVVWCIDPQARRVVVMRPGEEPEQCTRGGKASAWPVLDLVVPIDELFDGLR